MKKIWKVGLALSALVVAMLVMLTACGSNPVTPTPISTATPPPTCVVTVTNNGDGSVTVNGCGNTIITGPSPSPSPGSGGDNDVVGFAIFCYGFGTPEGQPEPNHNLCSLPVGYPSIAVTSSPKNSKGLDIPNPGDITSDKIVDWTISVTPSNGASLAINPANRFNATVVPASPRISGTVFTLTSKYKDPSGNVRDATKTGAIQ